MTEGEGRGRRDGRGVFEEMYDVVHGDKGGG